MIRHLLIGYLLIGQLVSPPKVHAENYFEAQNFKVLLSFRENRDRSLNLLSVKPTAEYAAKVGITADECARPQKRWGQRPLTLGIYPIADQVISRILIDARLGTGPWPKPLNLPKLTSWDINVTSSPDSLSVRDGLSERDIREILLKQISDKSVIQETGVIRVPVSPRMACDVLSGAVQVSAVTHIRFMHPDKDVHKPFSSVELRQVYRSLFSQFTNLASYSLVRKTFELARAIDAVTGDHFDELKTQTLAEMSDAYFSDQGELKPFGDLDAQKLETRLTEYSDRIIELDLETRNNPTLQKELR